MPAALTLPQKLYRGKGLVAKAERQGRIGCRLCQVSLLAANALLSIQPSKTGKNLFGAQPFHFLKRNVSTCWPIQRPCTKPASIAAR